VQLVDTSAWIEVFRRAAVVSLDDIVDNRDEVATCLPVIQEVLQGFDNERAFRIAQEAMYALPCIEAPLGRLVFDSAIDLYRRARHAGVTVRSSTDCLIAACALRHGLSVVHCDRDYGSLARIAPLTETNIRPILNAKRSW
jgi:predicted nucleic acid-binding protein